MGSSVDSSRVMRDAELVSIADASQQECDIFLLRRISFCILDYVHSERWPRVEHDRVLSWEQYPSHIGVGSGILASILSPLLDGRNVLSDIQLCPEINVVCSETSIINSGHSVIDANSFVIDDDGSGNKWDLPVRSYPGTLALLHGSYGEYVSFVRFDGVPDNSDDSYDFNSSHPPWRIVIPASLGIIAIWWGWDNLRRNQRLTWGTVAFLSGIILVGYEIGKFLEWSGYS
jgi:hypothetical protein